ncbi:MAG: ABC transporter permease [Solirubrobacteraceae bacterium]
MTVLNGPPLRGGQLKEQAASREGVLLGVLAVEIIVLAQLSPYFLTVTNLLDTSRYFVESGLIALGMTFVIITGGIDLSVGGGLALASVCLGFGYQAGIPLPLAIAGAVVVGTAGGALNGVLVTRWDVHPIAITIATQALFRGIAYAITNANAVSTFPHWFNYFGQYYLGAVPGQLLVFVVAAVALAIVLHRGRLGRYVHGIGVNDEAALFSGVPVKRTKVTVYALTGLLVGVAAVIYTSRVSTARADAGLGLELAVIAAVVLGGASINGGLGSILGTVLGVVIIAVLQQGLLLTTLNSNWIPVITGGLMLAGVFVNEFFRRREE